MYCKQTILYNFNSWQSHSRDGGTLSHLSVHLSLPLRDDGLSAHQLPPLLGSVTVLGLCGGGDIQYTVLSASGYTNTIPAQLWLPVGSSI